MYVCINKSIITPPVDANHKTAISRSVLERSSEGPMAVCICWLKCWGTAEGLIHRTRWKLWGARSLKRPFSTEQNSRMDVNTETRPAAVVSATRLGYSPSLSPALCSAIMPSRVALTTLFFCVLKRRYSSVLVSTQASLENDWRAFIKAI